MTIDTVLYRMPLIDRHYIRCIYRHLRAYRPDLTIGQARAKTVLVAIEVYDQARYMDSFDGDDAS